MSYVIDPNALAQIIQNAIGTLINIFATFIQSLLQAIEPYVPLIASVLVGIGIVELVTWIIFRRSLIRTLARWLRFLRL